jgi:hypothetical protein
MLLGLMRDAPNGKQQSRPTPAASSKASTITLISRRAKGSGRCIDGARPARYWTAVKLEIARRQGIAIGLAGADVRA